MFTLATGNTAVDGIVRDVEFYKGTPWAHNFDYEDAASGELLYEVNFNGDDMFTPGAILSSSKMNYDVLDDNTLRVYGNQLLENNAGAIWGGAIGD